MTPDDYINTTLFCNVREGLQTLKEAGVKVQCVVTSPPYWGLRDYGTAQWEGGNPGCNHKEKTARNDGGRCNTQGFHGSLAIDSHKGDMNYRTICPKCGATRIDKQLGLEPTPQEYIANMVEVFRGVREILAEDGCIFVNMGDSYCGGGVNDGTKNPGISKAAQRGDVMKRPSAATWGSIIKPKDLVGIPWLLAFALRDDGWYLRCDIIWCLSGGTWVYAKTQKGEMPMMIKDMVRLDPKTVKLWNGEKWTQVLGWSKSPRQGTELEIVLRSGERISCSENHRFPTQDGIKAAIDLEVGDILERTSFPEPENSLYPENVPLNVAWFVGLYIAEGSRSQDTIQITLHAKEQAKLVSLRRIAQSYGGSVTYTVNGNTLNVRIYSRILNAIIDQFVSGRTSRDKCLSPICWKYENAFLRQILEGYLQGDGYYDEKNDRWRLGFTRNYNLERDLRTLAGRLGFHLVLNLSRATYQNGEKKSFRGEIRFSRSNHRNEKSTEEVVEIRKAKCRWVYDIGVEDEPHLFALASGILTHNSKPNPMPESVRDRPTRNHEYVFLLSKSRKYFYDADAIRTQGDRNWLASGGNLIGSGIHKCGGGYRDNGVGRKGEAYGANARSVWTIATQAYPGSHFATYPQELVKKCVLAGTSEKGCCPECGKQWERVVVASGGSIGKSWHDHSQDETKGRTVNIAGSGCKRAGDAVDQDGKPYSRETIGWQPSCTCGLDPVPAIVLDPFMGSGTTGQVAENLGRKWIGIELNKAYAPLIRNRTRQIGLGL